MSELHSKKELIVSSVLLSITTVMFALSAAYLFAWVVSNRHPSLAFYVCNGIFFFLVTAFAYGNFLYQLTRIGYYMRLGVHVKTSRPKLSLLYTIHSPRKRTLSILIPSYKEEVVTVEQTLFSAALMGYPNKLVNVLLDDPVSLPGTPDYRHTQRTIKMIESVSECLSQIYQLCGRAYVKAGRRLSGPFVVEEELKNLSRTYLSLARWLQRTGDKYDSRTHTDKLFVQEVFYDAAALYARRADEIVDLRLPERIVRRYILEEYAYIRDLFATKITTLQRKNFENLSQEPNKAMNINSYLSLMGGMYKVERYGSKKPRLVAVKNRAEADIVVPETDYVITLDADSILDHRYAATLIEIMERPGNERLAVAQTPYSAIAGTESLLERSAGATTDIQYIIHQGFTKFGATYWVGANALLRKQALDDIAEPIKGERLVKQYIQDRTVIEDTESSIDLVSKSWMLYNHPDRLAYSATPSDYGSLLIQRRRWANGGLIILPKLLAYLLLKPSLKKVPEGFMRIHYLASIAMVNVGLVIMLFIPLEKVGFSIWVPMTAVPYFYLYHRDLKLLGYGFLDIFRVYALNLLLIPINVGGALKSIQQLATGRKIPFGRTPKVGGRTSAPPLYHFVTYGLFVYLLFMIASDVITQRFLYAALLGINAYFLGYALVAFIGIKSTLSDIYALRRRIPHIRRRAEARESA
jgi:cellulose synthase (UDP-forming)